MHQHLAVNNPGRDERREAKLAIICKVDPEGGDRLIEMLDREYDR